MAKKTREDRQATTPKVKITLRQEPDRLRPEAGGNVVQGMGLRRIGHTVELLDTPATRGMILKVRHLVTVLGESSDRHRTANRIHQIHMNLSNLRPPKGAKHSKKRVGRGQGSGQGMTAGRGHKGAKSRSGFKHKRGFEGGQMPLHRRVPKRGFHNPFRVEYEVVNLDTLAERFDAGAEITPELLREHGLVGRAGARQGARRAATSRKALTVRAHKFSGKAAEKIAAAGGKAEVLA